MSLLGISLAGIVAAYAWLAVVLQLRGTRTWHSRAFALAAIVTAAWALFQLIREPGSIDITPSLRDAAWLAAIISIIRSDAPDQRLWRFMSLAAAILISADLLFCGLQLAFPITPGLQLDSWATRMALAAFGLLLLENLLRNSSRDRFWALKLGGIGLGLVFAFNLSLEIPRLFTHNISSPFVAVQPLIYLLVFPLLVVTAIRMPTVSLKVHSSRQAVFHSATLVALGIVVEGMAAAAYFVRTQGGTVGTVFFVVLLFSAVAVALVAATSTTFRSRVRQVINENFFSYKYDYRREWSRFIASLSARDEQSMPLKVMRTLADLMDCPGGLLLIRHSDSLQLSPLAHWSIESEAIPMRFEDAEIERLEKDSVSYIAVSADSADPLARRMAGQYGFAWLAVPLRYRGRMIGIAILCQPRVRQRLNWEDEGLITLMAEQLAIYLVHDEARRDLADARQLEAFNQRIAFVIHDMKSSIGQLSLLAGNAERFGHDEQFRKDMVETIRHSAANLQELMQRLKGGVTEPRKIEQVDICALLQEFVQSKIRLGLPVEMRTMGAPTAPTEIDKSALLSVLEHVVSNAIEASPSSPVRIGLDRRGTMLRISVQDCGRGMAPTFLADELFRPLHSTKGSGFGLGAYQARQTMRDLRGNLEISSKIGAGTTVELVLPAMGNAT